MKEDGDMNELQYEQAIELLGSYRKRLRQLEDMDYMTAYYKGYSASGMTLDEIKETIDALTQEIRELEDRMEGMDW